jgi:hypothetical protein
MARLGFTALTVALAIYSYFEIKTGLPLLTAHIRTHSGSSAPVGELLSAGLYISWFLQLLLAALLIGAPYVAPQSIHLGAWRLGRHAPDQQVRILPLVRELTALLALLTSSYFAARIHLEIHSAQSHGPQLPADWLKTVDVMELEWLAALVVIGGIIIYLYLAKFEEIAGEE